MCIISGIDHHWSKDLFVTCGSKVQVWDPSRSEPTHEFAWGADSITSVKFNPSEESLLASCGSDRNIALYDVRMASSMRKIVLEMRSNALAWNPMEPFNFTVANEDHNLYTFDMRKMQRALLVHKDHVSAVYAMLIWGDRSPASSNAVSFYSTVWTWRTRRPVASLSRARTTARSAFSGSTRPRVARCTTPSACSGSSVSSSAPTPRSCSRAVTTPTFVSGRPRPTRRWARSRRASAASSSTASRSKTGTSTYGRSVASPSTWPGVCSLVAVRASNMS
jgi:WD40 repeat protein